MDCPLTLLLFILRLFCKRTSLKGSPTTQKSLRIQRRELELIVPYYRLELKITGFTPKNKGTKNRAYLWRDL